MFQSLVCTFETKFPYPAHNNSQKAKVSYLLLRSRSAPRASKFDRERMDDETARLILQLQLEELEEASSKVKGKQPAREVSDYELALSCYKDELVSEQLKELDEQAAADRELALQSQVGYTAPQINTDGQPQESKIEDGFDEELLESMAAIYVVGPGDDHDSVVDATQPESSASATSRADNTKDTTGANGVQCVSCLEHHEFDDVTEAPCAHDYCRRCLQELFARSLTDESLFPPRCCGQSIPAEANRMFLSPHLMGEYQAKKLEVDTPNRTYCHQPHCSAFIPPYYIRDNVARCARCKEKTCVICKGASHKSDCPEDPAMKMLLQQAAENGWQRCHACHRLVELNFGCFHISKSCPSPPKPYHGHDRFG